MIWIVVLTFIGVIALIQTLNNYYKNKAKDESSSTNSTTAYNTNNYSVVTGEKINEEVSQESSNSIKNFFYYCNNEQIEYAYNLLSADCKDELYPKLEDFKTKYYDRIFTEKRSYDEMLWITESRSNTYRLQIYGDLLANGKKDDMPIEDYYTLVYENGAYRLNISGYIGKEILNISKTQNNITVTVVSRKIYKDYEKYEIKVENNTAKKLQFNTKQNTDSIYIQDENNLKYISYINEIGDSEFELIAGQAKTFNIRFNRGYKPTIKIQKIVFGDINGNETIQIDI